MNDTPLRILQAGATGTIGRALARTLIARGHLVTCLVRPESDLSVLPEGALPYTGPAAKVAGLRFDAVVSCIASRSGVPADAWAVDHDANMSLLTTARAVGAERFLLLSAICVQKPHLAFQHAKLAFEAELQASGLDWTIVRPTAYFKSLSGQVARVQAGKPFLAFGDGRVTACKPISDRDLADFLARALTDPAARNKILPIGGPGPALTPADQAALLSDLLGREVPIRHVAPWVMDGIVRVLAGLGRVIPPLRRKAELARIGRYYASESMLHWDGTRYDAAATPEHGRDTLRDHYKALIAGEVETDLGEGAVF